MVSDARIAELLTRDADLKSISQSLIDEANTNGGVDNVTVALVRYAP
jgi:protein phosphatase